MSPEATAALHDTTTARSRRDDLLASIESLLTQAETRIEEGNPWAAATNISWAKWLLREVCRG